MAGAAVARLRELEPVNRQARNAQHRLRVSPEDTMEGITGDTSKLGVTQRSHIRGTRPARNQPHLADDIASRKPPHEAPPVAVVRRKDAQASTENNIQGIGGFACGEQRCATRE